MKKNISINLSWVSFKSLHPILKNLYKKIEERYTVKYINKWIDISKVEIPKLQKNKWIKKNIYYIYSVINNFIPRFNIIIWKHKNILTANNFLLTKNDYKIITSSLIQFSWLKTKPLYNIIFKKIFKYFLLQ